MSPAWKKTLIVSEVRDSTWRLPSSAVEKEKNLTRARIQRCVKSQEVHSGLTSSNILKEKTNLLNTFICHDSAIRHGMTLNKINYVSDKNLRNYLHKLKTERQFFFQNLKWIYLRKNPAVLNKKMVESKCYSYKSLSFTLILGEISKFSICL